MRMLNRRFVWFTGADMTKPDGIDVLRKNLMAGAIGLGELKSHVACVGPEIADRVFTCG
jgi:hypothetical protein